MANHDKTQSSLDFNMKIHRTKKQGESNSKMNESISRNFREVETSQLKPHPRNKEIYGNEDVSDLVELIKEQGRIIDNLVINRDNIIISGHRRWLAAQDLNFPTVPCEVIPVLSNDEELELLIHYNASREKTFEQKIRESMTLEEVYSTKAEKRRLSNLKQNNSDVDNLTISGDSMEDAGTKGATRDVVAKKAGIASGKTYNRGKNVVLEIDRLRESGNADDADLLVFLLNKSASLAEDFATKLDIATLPEDTKNELKLGKISARSIIPKTRSMKSKNKTPNNYTTAKEHLKAVVSSINSLKNLDLSGVNQKQKQKLSSDVNSIIENLQKILHPEASLSDEPES